MFRRCTASFQHLSSVKNYQKNYTAEEFEEHRKYLQLHSPCGAFKTRVDDRDYISCPVCNRTWCIIGECNATFTLMSNYISHKLICPFGRPEFTKNCSKCRHSKTREEIMKSCPQCGIYWCLISSCSYEHDTEAMLVRHQTEAHFYF